MPNAQIPLKPALHFPAFLAVFALFFTTQMDFRSGTTLVTGNIDVQVIVRLATLGLLSLYFLPHISKFLLYLRETPIALHAVLLIYLLIVSSNPAIANFYSFYTLIFHILLFYITVICVARWGLNQVLYYYFVTCALISALSLFTYYLMPEIGRYSYWQDDVFSMSSRMKGISGHPNTLGFTMASACLVFAHLKFQKFPMPRLFWFAIILILSALILTNSRTSLGGAILMVSLYTALYLRFALPAAIMGVLGAWVILLSIALSLDLIPDLLTLFSRSGDISEITTLTGRSHVWEVMWALIEQKPFFGWGYGVLGEVLLQNADKVGFSVAQAHNFFLQLLFSGGFIGLLIFLMGFISAMVIAIMRGIKGHPFELCLLIYILLGGITEAMYLTTIPTITYLMLIVCLTSLSGYNMRNKIEV